MLLTIKQEIDFKIDAIGTISKQKHLSNDIRNKSLITLTYKLLELLKEEKKELKELRK